MCARYHGRLGVWCGGMWWHMGCNGLKSAMYIHIYIYIRLIHSCIYDDDNDDGDVGDCIITDAMVIYIYTHVCIYV